MDSTSHGPGADRGPGRVRRALYRGGRPTGLASVMNRISAIQFSAGFLSPRRGVTLEVVGRRSGRPITFPLVVAEIDGERYLVSMLGADAGWVHNVHAAGGRAVLHRRGSEHVLLVDVDPAMCAPILRRYLELAPGARAHIPVDRRSPVEAFEAIAAQYPVFRVTSDPAAAATTAAAPPAA